MNEKIACSMSDLEPNLSTFTHRCLHFMNVTNPKHFFVSDQKILESRDTVRNFQKLTKESCDGIVMLSQTERKTLL